MDQNPTPASEKKRLHIKLIIAIILFLGILFLYFGWVTYWSPSAKKALEYQEKVKKAERAMIDFENAMRNDIYGGKTPEETLAMFIDALKNGDTDLASKYFMLDTNMQSPNYLTRNEWKNVLSDTIKTRGIEAVLEVLNRAIPQPEDSLYEGDFKFISKNLTTKMIDMYINMELNKYSGVWKIESM